jgi:hypothetical protein
MLLDADIIGTRDKSCSNKREILVYVQYCTVPKTVFRKYKGTIPLEGKLPRNPRK